MTRAFLWIDFYQVVGQFILGRGRRDMSGQDFPATFYALQKAVQGFTGAYLSSEGVNNTLPLVNGDMLVDALIGENFHIAFCFGNKDKHAGIGEVC